MTVAFCVYSPPTQLLSLFHIKLKGNTSEIWRAEVCDNQYFICKSSEIFLYLHCPYPFK